MTPSRGTRRIWAGSGIAALVIAALAVVAATQSSGGATMGAAQRAGSSATPGSTAPSRPTARPAGTAGGPAGTAGGPGPAAPGSSPSAPGTAGTPTTTGNPFASLETRVAGDPLALGRVGAPVIMVEWADFQCPFCGRFARDTEPVLVRRYVDTGELRIEWRDFPYLGPQSTTAARAARAAADQGRFWQYHNALYADQHPVNSGALTGSYLVSLAARLGLNTARFRADMNSPATARAVRADFQQGIALGINGTPAFLIGRTPVFGAQPTATFEKIINAALARAR